MLVQKKRNILSAYLYISPFYVLFAVFGLFPIYYTFSLTLYKWDGLTDKKWVGLDNFRLLFEDPLFWTSIWNTLIIGILGTAPQIILGLLLAFVLNQKYLKMKSLFQTLYFIPNITSIVAVAIIFTGLFSNSEQGIVNSILYLFGVDAVAWNVDTWGIKITISFMILWRWTGYVTIIFLAGLQSIPNDLYESAKIDGATWYDELRRISIPLLRPFIVFVIFLATIGSLQLFTEPFVFLRGSIRAEGSTIVTYLYQYAFQKFNLGYASAVAVVLFFIIVSFSAINFWIVKKSGR